MPQELQFESHLKKKFALLILTLITRYSLEVTAFDLVYTAPCLSSGLSLSLTLVSSSRKWLSFCV